MKIIAFYGPQGSGKSEAAKAISSILRVPRLSFAGPLYEMMSCLLDVDARTLDKAATHEGLCGKTLREALQSLGTDWGRNMIGETIWLDAMHRKLRFYAVEGQPAVVIDDLRFANEYRFLRDRGAYIVRIDRPDAPSQENSVHASEADWRSFVPDVVLTNTTRALFRKNAVALAQCAPDSKGIVSYA